MHSVDGLVFEEELVVFGNGDEEEDGGDILKAVYPLLPLRSLTSDIEHAVCKLADDESSLSDASGLHSRSEYVLVVGEVIWLCDSADRVEVTEWVGLAAA